VSPANFLSDNPRFCRSFMAGYSPQDFIALLQMHDLSFHEKHHAQLFGDGSAEDVINRLPVECAAGQVEC
jgi:predicted flavoprotein YhiN